MFAILYGVIADDHENLPPPAAAAFSLSLTVVKSGHQFRICQTLRKIFIFFLVLSKVSPGSATHWVKFDYKNIYSSTAERILLQFFEIIQKLHGGTERNIWK